MASEQPTGRAPYREQHRADRARRVRHDALREETRARLAAAAHGQGAWCLRGESGVSAWSKARRLLIAALVTGLGAFAAAHPDSLTSLDLWDPPTQSLRLATAALLLQGLGLLAALEVRAARQVAGRSLPRGVYLFARELVDARAHDLVLHDTEGLAEVRARGEQRVLTFRDGARFAVDAGGLDPDALRRAIDERRAEALRGEADGDRAAAAWLDPLAAERADGALSGSSGHRRLGRLARLAALAVLVPAAMLTAALTVGRAVAIERAVRHEQIGSLGWFAQTDRWMSGWAARRWADAALRPGGGPLQETYLLYGPDPRGFARRLEAQTGDCSGLPRQECAGTVKALCESRFHDPAALRRAVSRLDAVTTSKLGPRCQRIFDRQGWSLQELSGEQLARAVASRDVEVLWALPSSEARPVVERLYDQGRAQLAARRDTPTRRALDAALVHLREHDVELGLRVVMPASRTTDEQSASTQALLHHLGRQPFGSLLRLATAPRPREAPRALLTLEAGVGGDTLDAGSWGSARGGWAWNPGFVTGPHSPRHVWDEAWLEARLVVRATRRREAEVTAVHWTLATRALPAIENPMPASRYERETSPRWKPADAASSEPWVTTTFEAPLDPPVRWSEATSLDDGASSLIDRLL